LISAHQNDLKTPKNINLKQRTKNKINSNFFKNAFETQKQTGLRNSVKKTYKNCCTKTAFQTQFFSGSRSTKRNLICYQISCCVCFTTNIKASGKQMQH
jgi:hypothetical protein